MSGAGRAAVGHPNFIMCWNGFTAMTLDGSGVHTTGTKNEDDNREERPNERQGNGVGNIYGDRNDDGHGRH